MPLVVHDLDLDAGADWQRVIHLRDPNTYNLVPLSDPVMEVRNTNMQLAMRLDPQNGRCVMLDANRIQLAITAADSRLYFGSGNFPGQYQAIGFWGIGRSYRYDLFVVLAGGATERIMRGFLHVSPPITNPTEAQISGPVAYSRAPS